MTITAYLAGRYSRRAELAAYAAELRRAGITVSSRWLAGTHTAATDGALTAAESRQYAQEDIEDIDRAHVLVWFGDPPHNLGTRGGASWEAGYAYGCGIPPIVVGHRQSVFAHLPDVTFFPDWETARTYISGLHARSNGRLVA